MYFISLNVHFDIITSSLMKSLWVIKHLCSDRFLMIIIMISYICEKTYGEYRCNISMCEEHI